MKRLLIMVCAVLFAATGFAQDPIHWEFSAKKIGAGKYELHLKATVDHPWHTYSQTTPDGGPLPTKIAFGANPLVKMVGAVKEVGEMKTIHDNVFDVDVKYFPGDVDFVQEVTLRQAQGVKTKVTGTVEFMVCNDKQCLPPKSIAFSIQLQ